MPNASHLQISLLISSAGEIEFGEFLQVFESQQEAMAKLSDETDTIDAFVALGGGGDKSGSVSAEKLSRLCKACSQSALAGRFRQAVLLPRH